MPVKKYRLVVFPTHVEFNVDSTKVGKDQFLFEISLDNGSLEKASLRYRNYRTELTSGQIAIANLQRYYTCEGSNLHEIFSNYTIQNEQYYRDSASESLCRFAAYLLFFNFIMSDYFSELVPLTARLPFEKFSDLLKRSNFPLLTYLFTTANRISKSRELSQYLILIQNFINTFDLLFVEGDPLSFLDMAGFVTNILLDVALLNSTVIASNKMCEQRLTSELSCTNESLSEISELPINEIPEGIYLFRNASPDEKIIPEAECKVEYGSWLLEN